MLKCKITPKKIRYSLKCKFYLCQYFQVSQIYPPNQLLVFKHYYLLDIENKFLNKRPTYSKDRKSALEKK